MRQATDWKKFKITAGLWLPLLLLLPAWRAVAQCNVSPPPAGCPVPFVALDVATGQEVQALCVGRAVRFQPGCGRVVAPNLLYYNALPGQNTTPANCDFLPGQLAGNIFTPTAAGALTVSELTNPAQAGGTGTVYVRNFQVLAAPPPQITVRPCARNSASLLITATGGYDSYQVQINGGPPIGPLGPGLTTLPAAAGSTITVTGRYAGNALCGGQSTATVPPLPNQPLRIPTLTVRGPLPGPVDFTFSGLSGALVNTLQVADPARPTRFRGVVSFFAPSSTTLNLALPGLYRLANYDACGLDSTFSEPVPAISLAAAPGNNVVNLSWPAFGPVQSYALLRNGQTLTTLPPGTSAYADAAVSCGTAYRYQLRTLTVGGSVSLSNEVTVTAASTLAPPPPLLLASFDPLNRLTLTARQASGAPLPARGQLVYSRQGGPGNVDFAPVAPLDTLRDPAPLSALLAAPPCYTVRYLDPCGNPATPAPPTCPALLTAEAADPDGLSVRLSWTPYRGPGAGPATYQVLSLNPDGSVRSASAPTAALTFVDNNPPADRQLLRYRVAASGAGLPAGTVSLSNTATLARRVRLVVPTAFTPNGDGVNDVLELKGRYLNGFLFVIIDRNGQEAFRATDRSQTWDGRIRNQPPVPGAYVWRLTLQDETGQPFTETGTVTILQ